MDEAQDVDTASTIWAQRISQLPESSKCVLIKEKVWDNVGDFSLAEHNFCAIVCLSLSLSLSLSSWFWCDD